MTDEPTKPIAEGSNMAVESTTEHPETENTVDQPKGDAVDQPADDIEPGDEEAAAQMGNLS